jgi:hypothetical protein
LLLVDAVDWYVNFVMLLGKCYYTSYLHQIVLFGSSYSFNPYSLLVISIFLLLHLFFSWVSNTNPQNQPGFTFNSINIWKLTQMLFFYRFLETFAVGWLFGFEKQIERSGAKAYYLYMITTFGSILLASILWFTLEKNAIWAGFVALILTYAFGMGWTILFLLESANEPLPEALMDLAYGNMRDYKATLEPVIGWVPHIFCILVKHFIPQVLLILFVNLAASKVPGTDLNLFGNYGGYPNLPYQFMGILVVVLALLVFVAGVIAPSVYSGFVSLDKEIEEGTKPSFPVKKPKEVDVDGLEA